VFITQYELNLKVCLRLIVVLEGLSALGVWRSVFIIFIFIIDPN
jgi:hypothetical protein